MVRTQHCGYWCPGTTAPDHQYPQCWPNMHCILVSFKIIIFGWVNSIQLFYLQQKYKHTSTLKRIYCKVDWGIQKPERFICPHSNPMIYRNTTQVIAAAIKWQNCWLTKLDRNTHRCILVCIYMHNYSIQLTFMNHVEKRPIAFWLYWN